MARPARTRTHLENLAIIPKTAHGDVSGDVAIAVYPANSNDISGSPTESYSVTDTGILTARSLTLVNGEAIDNTTNGTVNITAATFKHTLDSNDSWNATITNTGPVTFTAANSSTSAFRYASPVHLGSAVSEGLWFGMGTASAAATTATASACYGKFYTATTATSGDNRGLYWKHTFSGAGAVSGECIRARAVVGAALTGAQSVHGIHAEARLAAGGSCAGEACGIRATLAADASSTITSGTLCALRLDSDFAVTSSAANAAFIGVFDVNGTNKMPYFINFDASATSVITADTSNLPAVATHKIKCKVGSTEFYLIGVADF